MSWNNAYERKKFNARIRREIAEYQAAGMTDEQIAEIVMFDEEQFRNDRRYRMHTQEFCESDFDGDDGGDNGKSPLTALLMDADLNFSEFDDVTIRRIVECIQVNTDKHILVTLKGGLQGEELI